MPVLGLVLAGGLGRRMGGADKPLLRLAGRTLLEHVGARLAPQCPAGLALSANGDPDRFPGFPGPILPDALPDRPGPLAGVLAGLAYCAAHRPEVTHLLSVPGDAPFLPGDLATRLAAPGGLAHAASGGRGHYTVALWPVSLRAALHEALAERGERRVGAFLGAHGAVAVDWPAEPHDPFLNLNTAGDLAAAEAISIAGRVSFAH